jgi:hypothetical protein
MRRLGMNLQLLGRDIAPEEVFRASRSGTPRGPNLRVGRESRHYPAKVGRFAYYDEKDRLIRDREILKRIRSLAVPPAYRNV